jgi:hypothetical protein
MPGGMGPLGQGDRPTTESLPSLLSPMTCAASSNSTCRRRQMADGRT